MKNKILRTLCILLCGGCILSCAACNFSGDRPNSTSDDVTETEPVIITELNQPFKNSELSVTITDIDTERGDNDDSMIVSANFVIQNLSKQNITLSPFCINTYVDDVAITQTNQPATIAPNKLAKFNYEPIIPQNAKTIEFYFYNPIDDMHVATFTFNVPSLEKME